MHIHEQIFFSFSVTSEEVEQEGAKENRKKRPQKGKEGLGPFMKSRAEWLGRRAAYCMSYAVYASGGKVSPGPPNMKHIPRGKG